MTKQEQIEEMAKYICNVCEMGHGFNGDCSEGGTDFYKRCILTQETAKALYNAGYRKVVYDRDCLSDLLNEEIKQLETELQQANEIERLKSENVRLATKLGQVLLSIDIVKEMNTMCSIDEQRKQAKIDVLNKLKKCSCCDIFFADGKWHRYVFVSDIDRLIKEVQEE